MESIHAWTVSIAAAVIISSVVQILLPEGKTTKYVRVVCAVITILCILAPIKSIDFERLELNFSGLFSESSTIKYVTVVDEQTKRLYEKRLTELLTRGLNENCKLTPVSFGFSFSGEGGETVLDNVTVHIAKKDAAKAAACEYYICKTLGLNGKIKVGNGNE